MSIIEDEDLELKSQLISAIALSPKAFAVEAIAVGKLIGKIPSPQEIDADYEIYLRSLEDDIFDYDEEF